MNIDNSKSSSKISVQLTFDGQEKILEMSRYADFDPYHKIERSHPYHVEMIEEIRGQHVITLCT